MWYVDKYKITCKLVISHWTNETLQHIVVPSGLSRPGIIDARARCRASARRLRNTTVQYVTVHRCTSGDRHGAVLSLLGFSSRLRTLPFTEPQFFLALISRCSFSLISCLTLLIIFPYIVPIFFNIHYFVFHPLLFGPFLGPSFLLEPLPFWLLPG